MIAAFASAEILARVDERHVIVLAPVVADAVIEDPPSTLPPRLAERQHPTRQTWIGLREGTDALQMRREPGVTDGHGLRAPDRIDAGSRRTVCRRRGRGSSPVSTPVQRAVSPACNGRGPIRTRIREPPGTSLRSGGVGSVSRTPRRDWRHDVAEMERDEATGFERAQREAARALAESLAAFVKADLEPA